jgi:hypothetical protein
MKVYIGQYGYFWSLSMKEWVAICQEAAKNGFYDLDGYKELKKPPKGIAKNVDDNTYYAVNNDVIYLEPIDWHSEEFADWLEKNGFPREEEEI